jgi:hypothetical protein
VRKPLRLSGGPGPEYAGNLAADLRPEEVALLPRLLRCSRNARRPGEIRCVPPGLPLSFYDFLSIQDHPDAGPNSGSLRVRKLLLANLHRRSCLSGQP